MCYTVLSTINPVKYLKINNQSISFMALYIVNYACLTFENYSLDINILANMMYYVYTVRLSHFTVTYPHRYPTIVRKIALHCSFLISNDEC